MKRLSSILLVENNQHDQKLMQRVLKKNIPHCHVPVVQTGDEALQALSDHYYDVVLLDFQLNDMSGLEIFQQMKKRGDTPATIFVTGQGNEQVAVEAIQAGAQNYLVKDIASEYLKLLPTAVLQAYNQWENQQARRKAELALRTSEETLRTTFTSIDDLVFVLNRDGTCIICYKPLGLQLKEIFPASTIVGFHFTDVFPASLANPLKTIIKLVERSQQVEEFDFVLETITAKLWFNALVSPRYDLEQQYDGVTVVARDITARKETQLQLERQYQRQSALAELELAINQPTELDNLLEKAVNIVTELLPATGGASIILWDADEEEFFVSASSVPDQSPQMGQERVRREGGATRWIIDHQEPMIVPDVQTDPFTANTLLTEYDIQAYLGVPLLANNQVLGVLYGMHLSPRTYSANDVDFLISIAHRIALAVTKVQLYQELQQRQSDLQRQAEELAIQNAELEAFSGTVAHDLKNPLALITGYIELLQETGFDQPDMAQEMIATVAASSRRIVRIIDELLLLAQVRKKDVLFTPVDMYTVVQESIARLAFMIEKTNATITLPDSWLVAMGYGPWIEEIWANYISNAIKYGGESPQIELGSARFDETAVKFWVKDHGPGIRQDEQAKLFTPFTQLNQIRTQGHGLGLSIVQRIVEKLNGEVGVVSEVGQGSEFYFTLPAAE